MARSKQLHILATNPRAYARFVTTGQMPQGTRPASPLITLLESLGPRALGEIRGLTVDHRLGYTGSRTFAFGTQALRWVKPSDEVFGPFPAESWRDKRFQRTLTVEDLAECCAKLPHALIPRGAARRAPRPSPPSSAASADDGRTPPPSPGFDPMQHAGKNAYLVEIAQDLHHAFLREHERLSNGGSTTTYDAARDRTLWQVAGETVAESEGAVGTGGRYWAVLHLEPQAHALVVDQLSNNDSSSDDELAQFLSEEAGLSALTARVLLVERDRCLTEPLYEPVRERARGA